MRDRIIHLSICKAESALTSMYIYQLVCKAESALIIVYVKPNLQKVICTVCIYQVYCTQYYACCVNTT